MRLPFNIKYINVAFVQRTSTPIAVSALKQSCTKGSASLKEDAGSMCNICMMDRQIGTSCSWEGRAKEERGGEGGEVCTYIRVVWTQVKH